MQATLQLIPSQSLIALQVSLPSHPDYQRISRSEEGLLVHPLSIKEF